MHIANLLPQRMTCLLVLAVVCSIPTHTLAQADQEKDKAASQEKKPDEKKPATTVKGGLEILSDTMGVDFGPYMKQLRAQIQTHWQPLIPESAMPPLNKSGTVVIEFAIVKSGQVTAMKLIKTSGDVAMDRAAWGAITGSLHSRYSHKNSKVNTCSCAAASCTTPKNMRQLKYRKQQNKNRRNKSDYSWLFASANTCDVGLSALRILFSTTPGRAWYILINIE